jgi:glycosyltransferase involved in cell wall biosynthesis
VHPAISSNRPLRIGILSSVAHRTPPISYGPWEQVASTLTEGLVALGHEVTLFATTASLTTARLLGVTEHGYEEDADVEAKVVESLHIAQAFERASEFDVLSNQFDFLPLTYSRLTPTPVVTTIHGFSSQKIVPVYAAYDDIAHYVSISNADRHPALTYDATIHHGIALEQFTFRPEPGTYLLFLGRIHPHKGTHLAIEVAKAVGIPLVIAGVIQDHDYFTSSVAPHLDGRDVQYVGAVQPPERDALLGGAIALLHLISFAEPFGLSVVESLATGTPVIAYPLGSMPEILADGITGFLPDDVAAAIAAVQKIGELSRAACRAEVERRFTAERMVADYAALFDRVVSRDSSSGTSTNAKRTVASLAPYGSSSASSTSSAPHE